MAAFAHDIGPTPGELMRHIVLFAVAVLAACSRSAPDTIAGDRAAIDSIRREIEAAENAGDADRMSLHFAPDAVAMAPNSPATVGAETSRAGLRAFFDAFTIEIHYTSEEIVVSGDWAFDRGTSTERVTPKAGGPVTTANAKYLWLYQRLNGEWKQARVIWNSNDPLPNAVAPAGQTK
jgi:ketosteroid isomerase-like protein